MREAKSKSVTDGIGRPLPGAATVAQIFNLLFRRLQSAGRPTSGHVERRQLADGNSADRLERSALRTGTGALATLHQRVHFGRPSSGRTPHRRFQRLFPPLLAVEKNNQVGLLFPAFALHGELARDLVRRSPGPSISTSGNSIRPAPSPARTICKPAPCRPARHQWRNRIES